MYGYGYKYVNGLVVGSGGAPPVPPFANTKSLSFDGVDDYLSIGATFDATNGITLSCWVKYDGVGAGLNWLCSSGGTGGVSSQFNTRLVADGRWVNYYLGSPKVTGITGLSDGNWHNIIQTVNYSNGDVKFYKDGVVSATVLTYGSTYSTAKLGGIGGANSSGVYPFKGGVDEVSIFGSVLTPSEIVTVSTAPTVDLTSLNPIAWYRNGDNGSWKSPQWLIPNNENKDKVSNYSMNFDGTDQYLNIGAPSVLSNTSNFSISCWVKQTTVAINYRRVFGKVASASDMIFLGTAPTTNYFRFYIENGGSYSLVESNVGIGFNVWKHVTLVFDGSLTGNQNRAKIYVDGVNVTATDSGTIPATTTADASDFYLGKVNGLGSFYYYGNMDEFAIFDYSLTPAEVLSISSEPTDLTSLSPTSWLKLGDNSTFAGGVWTVIDEVGSNDGSSVNMDIDDRIGEAPNSENNGLSFNMDEVDRVTDVPT